MIEAIRILEELQRRSEHSFHKYTPFIGQESFHKSGKYVRLLLGGNQSGKSRAAAQEIAWWFTHSHPFRQIPDKPVLIYVISTEYMTLQVGIYRHLSNIIPDWEIQDRGPKVQGHNMNSYLISKRGDTIQFMSAKGNEEARRKFQAAEVDFCSIDEEIDQYIWDELQARMITTGGCFAITATLAESYDWIVELERRGERNDPHVFLTRLNTTENIYANKEQVNRLAELWDEDTKQIRFYGHSRRQFGLVYKGFTSEHIIESFDIPKSWPRWQVLDPGYRTFAGLWGTVTPFGQRIIYRELYLHQSELGDVVEEIQLNEQNEQICCRIVDDKEGSRLITGQLGVMSQLATYYGLYYTPAIKAVFAGIEEVRQNFKLPPAGEPDYCYTLDNKEEITLSRKCRLMIFSSCTNLINELQNYKIRPPTVKRDRNDPVDQPVKKRDHLCDCLRYWLILQPKYDFIKPDIDRDLTLFEAMRGGHDIVSLFERHQKRLQSNRVHEYLGTNT